MASRLDAGDTFIDVGANIGVFTIARVAPRRLHGLVVAIEASPFVYGELLDTLELNGGPTNVRPVNVAAAVSRTMADLPGPPEHRPDDDRGVEGLCPRGAIGRFRWTIS